MPKSAFWGLVKWQNVWSRDSAVMVRLNGQLIREFKVFIWLLFQAKFMLTGCMSQLHQRGTWKGWNRLLVNFTSPKGTLICLPDTIVTSSLFVSMEVSSKNATSWVVQDHIHWQLTSFPTWDILFTSCQWSLVMDWISSNKSCSTQSIQRSIWLKCTELRWIMLQRMDLEPVQLM